MDWGEAGVRIALTGVVLLAVCSSLLGVMLGWKLREREVRELQAKNRYLKGELAKVWAKKASVTIVNKAECGSRNFAGREENRWMKCSRPRGHHLGPNGTQHGYAGVFWGEGKR